MNLVLFKHDTQATAGEKMSSDQTDHFQDSHIESALAQAVDRYSSSRAIALEIQRMKAAGSTPMSQDAVKAKVDEAWMQSVKSIPPGFSKERYQSGMSDADKRTLDAEKTIACAVGRVLGEVHAKARISAILRLPEASGREAQAKMMAFDTDITPNEAKAVLSATPRKNDHLQLA
jgi:hypothetical protein